MFIVVILIIFIVDIIVMIMNMIMVIMLTKRARTGIVAGNHNSRVESSANGNIISIVTIIITRHRF